MIGTHRRPCVVAILLTFAVLFSACGGDDETADETTTTTERTTTTEPEATTTTTSPADDEPPELENTGEDFEAIMQSINAYEDWVFQHPDPALLDKYTDPACPCFGEEQSKLQTLADNDWRARGVQGRFSSVELVSRPAPGTAVVQVILESQNAAIIDATGEVVQDNPIPPPTRILISLTQTSGAWRVSGYAFPDSGDQG